MAARGFSSSVLVMTRSTSSSVIVAAGPGRGSSARPSSRSSRNRDRHFVTVARETPGSAATALIDSPSAQASTIRDRSASACAVFRRRAQPSSDLPLIIGQHPGASFGLGTSQAYQLKTN